jgi:hypothetical protein
MEGERKRGKGKGLVVRWNAINMEEIEDKVRRPSPIEV